MIRAIVLACAAAALAGAAFAAPIHADLPLWPSADAFDDETGPSIETGDWRLRALDCAEGDQSEDCYTWMRIEEFGLLDRGLTVAEAPIRAGLATASREPAFVVALPGSGAIALQIGFRGGSRYLLLTAKGGAFPGSYETLDPDCEEAGDEAWQKQGYRERRLAEPTFFRSDYCLARSPEGLAALAAAAKPDRAMQWGGPAEDGGR